MKTSSIVAILLVLAATTVFAAPLVQPEAPPAAVARPHSPMMVEITAALDASRAAVADLTRSLEGVTGMEQVMAVQREIMRLKDDARLETFRIQLRYAVAEGRTEQAARIEAQLDAMTAPRPAGVPVHREPASAGLR